MAMSPDDYIRAARGRRSVAPIGSRASRPVYAYSVHDLTGDDPVLRSFLTGGREAMSGVAVTDRVAMRNSVFFRAMSLIAGSMGMLPLSMMRREPTATPPRPPTTRCSRS